MPDAMHSDFGVFNTSRYFHMFASTESAQNLGREFWEDEQALKSEGAAGCTYIAS